MKKSYHPLTIAFLLFVSCVSGKSCYDKKTAQLQDFSRINQDRPKLKIDKNINFSEPAYESAPKKKRYILRKPSPINIMPKEVVHISDYVKEDILGDYINDAMDENGMYSGRYKIGSPYEVKGTTYYPERYNNYEEVGQASWYGSDFDGKKTANGETYYMKDFTAAHRTLPLPSVVKVTNLDNGKKVIVRVNDRGPFSKNRIIDVSKRAADQLGFKNKGLINVKIEFLKEETESLLSEINKNKKK